MTTFQKIIKYLAIAFAIFIIFSICFAILKGINIFVNVLGNNKLSSELETVYIGEYKKNMSIDLSYTNLIIKNGDSFKIETNNKDINVEYDENIINIKEKEKFFLLYNETSELIIYVPDANSFDKISIQSKSGKIQIEKLDSLNVILNLGAGKVNIDYLISSDKTKINGGVGEISINDGLISNLDLDIGVGKTSITSKLTNNNNINAGVGELNLNLLGNDYKIKANKGLGSIKLDSKDIEEDLYYGTGSNIIDIDGGIGSINIKYIDINID